MTDIHYKLAANDPRVLTGIGIRKSTVLLIPEATKGTALFGPYIDLPAGRYEAIIHFTNDAPCRGSATMDVCARTGSQILASRLLTADEILDNSLSAAISFSCPSPMPGVEVRLVVERELSVCISSLEILGELTDPDKWKMEIGDLPKPRVENGIRKGRNLYEGYQRGLAATSEDIRARVAGDADYRRASELARGRTIVWEPSLKDIFLMMKFYVPKLSFGHIVEFGCYKGGSAILMASLAQKFLPGAQVVGFDTFAGMPPTDPAVDLHRASDFNNVDLIELRQYAKEKDLYNLTFVQGTFEDTARTALEKLGKVVFCHIDCDILSSVETAYNKVKPHMAPGGYWVFDDLLAATCLGAVEAVEDLLIRRDGLNAEQIVPHYVFREPFDRSEADDRVYP